MLAGLFLFCTRVGWGYEKCWELVFQIILLVGDVGVGCWESVVALEYSLRSSGLLRVRGVLIPRCERFLQSLMIVILFEIWTDEVAEAYEEAGEVF